MASGVAVTKSRGVWVVNCVINGQVVVSPINARFPRLIDAYNHAASTGLPFLGQYWKLIALQPVGAKLNTVEFYKFTKQFKLGQAA
jgi:hypothetical protein